MFSITNSGFENKFFGSMTGGFLSIVAVGCILPAMMCTQQDIGLTLGVNLGITPACAILGLLAGTIVPKVRRFLNERENQSNSEQFNEQQKNNRNETRERYTAL